jgi:hypothetical protein
MSTTQEEAVYALTDAQVATNAAYWGTTHEKPATEALRNITWARASLETAERALVEVARETGWTWAEIGGALNITAQGAQQRHSGGTP